MRTNMDHGIQSADIEHPFRHSRKKAQRWWREHRRSRDMIRKRMGEIDPRSERPRRGAREHSRPSDPSSSTLITGCVTHERCVSRAIAPADAKGGTILQSNQADKVSNHQLNRGVGGPRWFSGDQRAGRLDGLAYRAIAFTFIRVRRCPYSNFCGTPTRQFSFQPRKLLISLWWARQQPYETIFLVKVLSLSKMLIHQVPTKIPTSSREKIGPPPHALGGRVSWGRQ